MHSLILLHIGQVALIRMLLRFLLLAGVPGYKVRLLHKRSEKILHGYHASNLSLYLGCDLVASLDGRGTLKDLVYFNNAYLDSHVKLVHTRLYRPINELEVEILGQALIRCCCCIGSHTIRPLHSL